MNLEIDISFTGMDKEINDDLYTVFFPEYVHLLYETAKLRIIDQTFVDGIWSSYCGLTAYSTGRYFGSRIEGDLDMSMVTEHDQRTTCPKCLENFMLSAMWSLP